MKTILILSILFSAIAWLPVGAELTETDLENIRQILREELQEAFRVSANQKATCPFTPESDII